jgi:ribose transport system substrate-binding protein
VLEPAGSQLCAPIKNQAAQSNLLISIVALGVCDDGSGSGAKLWAPGTLTFVGGQANRPGPDTVLKQALAAHPGAQKVALVVGAKGHPASDVSWASAWNEFSAQHPDWQLVDTVHTDWTVPDSFAKTQNLLTAHPDVSIVFSSYVDIADGVTKATESRGLNGKVSVYTTIGGNQASVEMIKSGKLTGMLPAYPSSEMAAGVEAIDAALKGKTVEKFIGGDGNPKASTIGVVTKENINGFIPDY